MSVRELRRQQSSFWTHHNPLCAFMYQGGYSRTSKHPLESGSGFRGYTFS